MAVAITLHKTVAKTLSYTLKLNQPDKSGTVYTNRGAVGAVTFTLPAPAPAIQGTWFKFRVVADQSVIVAGHTTGKIVAAGNAAADNVSFEVAGAKIGGEILVECDGTSWLATATRAAGGACVNGIDASDVRLKVSAKTADYTIIAPTTASGDRSGTIFTNRGAAGAVIFTLPAAAAALAGVFYDFLGAADQNFTIVTPVADTLTVVNDAAADSLAVSTASHKIGAHMRAICDGTAWFAFGDSVGDTFTVAT